MSWLSSFFKSKKPNLTPDISFQTPSQISPGLYNPMSELAKRRIQAGLTGEETPGVGFGKDFLSRTTNAPIASREARFREQEVPFLSSQLSSRGLARSAGPGLATDVLNRASLQKERDINDLLSQ